MESMRVIHTLPPWMDADARVLVLGTMPSPQSRERGCYYGHPQNRFWRVMAALFDASVPKTNAERERFLHEHHIALWDVLRSCTITGADDSSIRDPQPNDLAQVLSQAPIQAVFTTGTQAYRLYTKYGFPQTGQEAIPLPSTSPANCRYYTFDKLVEAYRPIRAYL